MRVNSRAKYIETIIGNLSKTDKEDWIPVYEKYLEFKNIIKTAKFFKISEKSISRYLFKVFKFEEKYNRNKYIFSNKGMLSKTNKKDWIPVYKKYLEIVNIRNTAIFFDIREDTLSKFLFKVFKFEKFDMKQVYNKRTVKTKQTCLERYGVDCSANSELSKDKARKTHIEKSGVDHNFKSGENREKAGKTKEIKYGDKNYNNREKFKETMEGKWGDRNEKSERTWLKKYRVSNPNKTITVKDKIKKTCLKKYGTEYALQSSEVRNKIVETNSKTAIKRWTDNYLKPNGYVLMEKFIGTHEEINGERFWKRYKFKHIICGSEFEGYFNVSSDKYMIRCKKCFPIVYGRSQSNIVKFIKDLGFEVRENRFDLISPYQIDIFIPELNIGFEYNGIFWHSSKYKPNRNYHRNKTELALKKGIKLYHIWEHDDEEIIKSMILNKLGKTRNVIYARKCEIGEVGIKEVKDFLKGNHLKGFCSSSLYLGLFYKKELVILMSLKKNKSYMELNRLCTLKNTTVIGGFSRLLKNSVKYIRENYFSIDKIVTFAYRDWTPDYKSSVYLRNGFKFCELGNPMLSYYNNNNGIVQNRQSYMKHKLKKLFPDVFKDNLTEREILEKKNIYALYNSGNWKFELNIT